MSRPTRRTARLVAALAVPAALVASAFVVSQASYSAYSDTTVNPTSNWTSGTVTLADNDQGAALFTVPAMKPGSAGSQCITVTSSGSLPSVVKLYTTTGTTATTNGLAKAINLTVTQGTGGTAGSCTGFTPLTSNSSVYTGNVDGFGSTASSYANGLGSWTTAGGSTAETRTYKFDYSLPSTTSNNTQGGTAAIGFTWEAQNS